MREAVQMCCHVVGKVKVMKKGRKSEERGRWRKKTLVASAEFEIRNLFWVFFHFRAQLFKKGYPVFKKLNG
jgi:hypothetical protein